MIEFIANCAIGIIQIWLSWYIAGTFVGSKKRSRVVQFIGALSVSLILGLINQLGQPFLNMFSMVACYALLIFIFYRTVWYYSILFAAIAVGVINFSETIMVFIMVGTQNIRLTPEFFLQDHIQIIGQCGGLLISLAVVYVLRMIFRKRKGTKQLPQNLAVVLFPITSLLTLLYVLSSVADVFSHRQTIYLSLILCTLLVVTNIASLIGNENVRRRYILQNEIDAMQHQEELTVGLLSQQEEHLKEMRAQAHDFKNHLLCLRSLVGDTDPVQDQSLQYIDELLQTVGSAEQFGDVRNEALRAILSNTVAACKAQGTQFRCRIDYSDFSFMSFSDISILFSNALNNAVEACAQRNDDSTPWIDFKVLRKGEMLFIQLANTIYGEVKKKNGSLLSTKTQPENHGIGFKNMERVVQRHGGNLTVDYDESVFRLYINLPVIDTEG